MINSSEVYNRVLKYLYLNKQNLYICYIFLIIQIQNGFLIKI